MGIRLPAKAKVVVVGGGTGSFALLGSLKEHFSDITSIVSMADDGGSTGVLRDELGVLPPGDVRQCLVALSETPKLRDLFNYRFEEGTFAGHAFGNLFLTALEKLTGNFAEAVETASEVLRVRGTVVPATLDNVRLVMTWPQYGTILRGEGSIDEAELPHDPRQARLTLEPAPLANPAALQAVKEADLVVIAPGDLYTSLGSLLIIDGFGRALAETRAKVIYVANLVTKKGHTEGMNVVDHAAEVERFAGRPILDIVLYNRQKSTPELAKRYAAEDAFVVPFSMAELARQHYRSVAGNFLADQLVEHKRSDTIPAGRTYIRHNARIVSQSLLKLLPK